MYLVLDFGIRFLSMPAYLFALPAPCGRELNDGGEMTKPPHPAFNFILRVPLWHEHCLVPVSHLYSVIACT
jgi:hypothetical protein